MSQPTDAPAEPIQVIVRRRHDEDEGHHGGVWKIAYADFMTAMMAVFLVMWLVNAANTEMKSSVASYFNPIKLSDTVIRKKGLLDVDGKANADEKAQARDNKTPGMSESKVKDGKRTVRERAAKDGSSATYALVLENGVIVNHLVNWLSPRKERQCVVTGERGSLVADTLTGDLTYYANGTGELESDWDALATFRGVSEGDMVRYALQKREPLVVEHENFRDAILGEREKIVAMKDGLQTLRVIDACLRSAAGGRTITL